MLAKNYMEFVVENELDDLLEAEDMCKCIKCKNDIIAITLNNLPPRYYNTGTGYMFLYENFTNETNEDIIAEIKKAIAIVKKNPKHFNNDLSDFMISEF